MGLSLQGVALNLIFFDYLLLFSEINDSCKRCVCYRFIEMPLLDSAVVCSSLLPLNFEPIDL